jgi:16S rRNA processing protein RimM
MSISSDEERAKRVKIGRISGAHGVRGEIRITPLTDFPERFYDMKEIFVERRGKPPVTLALESVRSHEGKGQILVSAAGIRDKEAADALKGCFITVSPEERVTLPEGEFWIDSLIGLNVIDDASGERLGKVEDVWSAGSNDVYQIKTGDGATKLVPAIAEAVRLISIEDGTMRINASEGFWD